MVRWRYRHNFAWEDALPGFCLIKTILCSLGGVSLLSVIIVTLRASCGTVHCIIGPVCLFVGGVGG